MKNLIIRKKRSFLRKIIENAFVYSMWAIVLGILFCLIMFLCHIDTDNLATMYLLLNISIGEFHSYFEGFTWLLSLILVIGFFVQMNYGMKKEQKKNGK